MYSSTHQYQRDDAVKTGSGASFRDYVPTTDETKWIGTWADFRAARGMVGFNEDQTEICLHLPVGHKFSIQFASSDITGDTQPNLLAELKACEDMLLGAIPHASRICDLLTERLRAVRAVIAKTGG